MSLLGLAYSKERQKQISSSFNPPSVGFKGLEPYRGTDPIHGFLELISRPGWFLRSILAGDLEAAVKHATQFVADLPFGGFIDKKLSLIRPLDTAFELAGSDLVPDGTYDLTTSKEKYEFSDVLAKHGWAGLPAKGSWPRFGIDIAGGVIDPISLVGGPASGLAKGALAKAPSAMGRSMLKEALETGMTKKSSLLTNPALKGASDDETLDNILIHALEESGVNLGRYQDPGLRKTGKDLLKERAERSRAAGEARATKEFGTSDPFSINIGGHLSEPKYKGEYFWESLHADDLLRAQSWLREHGHIDTPGGITLSIPFTDAYSTTIRAPEKTTRMLRNLFPFNGSLELNLPEKMGELGRKIGSLWDRSNFYDPAIISHGAKDLSKFIKDKVHFADAQERDRIALIFGEGKEIDEALAELNLLNDPDNIWRNSTDAQKTALNKFQDLKGEGMALTQKEIKTYSSALGRGQSYRSTPRFSRAVQPWLVSKRGFTDSEAKEAVANLKQFLFKSLKTGGGPSKQIVHSKFKITRGGQKTWVPDLSNIVVKSPFRLENSFGTAANPRDLISEINTHLLPQGVQLTSAQVKSLRNLIGENLSEKDLIKTVYPILRSVIASGGPDLGSVVKGMLTADGKAALRASNLTDARIKEAFERTSLKFIEEEFPASFIGREIYTDLKNAGEADFSTWANGIPLQRFLQKQQSATAAPSIIADDIAQMHFSEYYNFLRSTWEDTLDYGSGIKSLGFEGTKDRKVSMLTADASEASMTVPEIAHKRLLADNRNRALKEVEPYIEALSKGINESSDEALRAFFRDMIGEVSFERGIFRKLLAGGVISSARIAENVSVDPFDIAAPVRTSSYETKLMGAVRRYTRIREDGSLYHDYHWGGVNKLYKPLLTSDPFNLAYHVGNAVGSSFMLATDKRVGWSGLAAVMQTAPALLGLTKDNEVWKLTLQALGVDTVKSLAATTKLRRIARATNRPEIIKDLDEYRHFLGGGHSLDWADLMQETSNTSLIFQQSLANRLKEASIQNIPSELYASWRKLGENWANFMESHLRIFAYRKFKDAGMSPSRAADRVQSLLVNYKVQSSLDQQLRDWFPFIRFQLASGAWTRAVLFRPKTLSPVALSQRASGESETFGDPSKTPMTDLGIGMPGGISFPTRAGAEATLRNLGLAATPLTIIASGGPTASAFSPIRQQAQSVHPLVQNVIEGAVGTELWSGKPYASDTRVPEGLKTIASFTGLSTKGMSRWGQEREEWSPQINKIIDSSPISRHLNTLSKIVKSVEGDSIGWTMAKWMGVKKRQEDALQNAKHKIRSLIKYHIEKGTIYEFQKVLSARRPEDTSPEVKLILDEYATTLRALRDRSSLDKASRGP